MAWKTIPHKVACAAMTLAIAFAHDTSSRMAEGATPNMSECCTDDAEWSCLLCMHCSNPSHSSDRDCKNKHEQRKWKRMKDLHEAVAKKSAEIERDARASGTKGCCFSVSWGARAHPENLKVSLQDLESCRSSGKWEGWRKAACPRNAFEASGLLHSQGGPWLESAEAVTTADGEPHQQPDSRGFTLVPFEGGNGAITLMALVAAVFVVGYASYRCNQARWQRFDEAEAGSHLGVHG
mmetsp:Transcript_81166/g.160926  ORF Transcript_81166/g.160926 Transcript_81166/m.160926 type:complete len:237 (+) Transcript_81166:39-749(+)|eukprot:CAMPEP_0172714048 /NCGR_PEP_ID=MMETSP1074-20121228/64566_1 /TAXON_ID=2916 /ORGANISM="Ceratium fusus, Strain PA161109" /LENGTH=236 /DNA_ID=CAMNT_0013538345 /DNA_START=33 /DNA_END=743 /DNA_ORIENTATION=+